MTVHDQARELAESIRNSDEYKSYIEAKEKASLNAELTDSLNDFKEKQFSMQQKQILGEEPGPEVIEQMQNLAQILMRDPLAAEYLQAEIRFTLMINDIYGILGEVIKSE